MPQFFQRPEIALKRANELLEVGKKQDALDALHDVIKSRRYKSWTKIHQDIMNKHLELCCELRKPHIAKDGLFQYRNMCQQINVKSLEDVIVIFLDMAEKKAEKAREESHEKAEDLTEDLDQAENPETLLLKAVSGEVAQDRTDRTVLSPWLKFLWESYRQCLELLRNNAQVEVLYHKVAKLAFQFCLKYQRKSEFRKLCDNLRSHLNQLQKMQSQTHSVKLSNPETLNFLQETRVLQLDAAIKMELWQEAFKSSEDLHNLMQLTKRAPKPQVMASYLEKLALVFWKAGNRLYHAASLYRLFLLYRDQKKSFGAEEQTNLATRVLLAVLSIQSAHGPSEIARHLDMEDIHVEHQRRLSSLLGLSTCPSRQTLIKDIQRLNVVSLGLPPAQGLLQWLETEFSPLRLAQEIEKHLADIETTGNTAYSQYVDALREVAAVKILKQISQLYQSITWERLQKVVPFFDNFRLEHLIVNAAKKLRMQIRLDQMSKAVIFGSSEELVGGEMEETSAIDPEGHNSPNVQPMPNEQIRKQLQAIYSTLQEAIQTIDPSTKQSLSDIMRNQVTLYKYHAADNHKKNLERRKRIETYKEKSEQLKDAAEREEREKVMQIEEERRRVENEELAKKNKEREETQRKEELEHLKHRMLQDKLERMKATEAGRKVVAELGEEDLQNIDAEALIQKQVTEMEREKREQQMKLKTQEKKWDHFVRAVHLEELPLLQEEYEKRMLADREFFELHEEQRVKRAIEEHQQKLELNQRLKRMEPDCQAFLASVRQSRASHLADRIKEFEQKLKEEKLKRLEERKQQRKEQRRQQWLKEQVEAEANRKRDAEAKKLEEEEKAARKGTGYVPPSARTSKYQPSSAPAPKVDSEGGDKGAEPDRSEEENWRSTMMKPTVRPTAAAAAGPPPVMEERREEPEVWRRPAARQPPVVARPPPPEETRVEPEGNWRERGEQPAAYRPPVREEREWGGEPQRPAGRPEFDSDRDDMGGRGDMRRRDDDRDEARGWRSERRPEPTGMPERSAAEPSGPWRRGGGAEAARPAMPERRDREFPEEPRRQEGGGGGGWRNQPGPAAPAAWGPPQPGGQPPQRGGRFDAPPRRDERDRQEPEGGGWRRN